MDGSITASAENSVLIHGDFANYVIADRVGFVVEAIPHLVATGNTGPADSVASMATSGLVPSPSTTARSPC